MTSRFTGRIAIVTGGGRGIGRGIALRFAREGAVVVIADQDRDTAEETADEIRRANGESLAIATDIADKGHVDAMIATTIDRYGRIDVLVNNAAIALLYEPFFSISAESWRRMIDVNLSGAFWCSQGTARHMAAQGHGAIVNIGSVNSFHPEADVAHYAASKGGILLLTRAMAIDLAPFGIRVNAIAPGATHTERTETFDRDPANEGLTARALATIPLRRRGETDEIAAAAVFLASDEASFVQGHTLVVDGGQLLL